MISMVNGRSRTLFGNGQLYGDSGSSAAKARGEGGLDEAGVEDGLLALSSFSSDASPAPPFSGSAATALGAGAAIVSAIDRRVQAKDARVV